MDIKAQSTDGEEFQLHELGIPTHNKQGELRIVEDIISDLTKIGAISFKGLTIEKEYQGGTLRTFIDLEVYTKEVVE